jgi:serine/threonine-protein kinase
VRRRHKRFAPAAGVFIGPEILEALAYAHAQSAHDGRPLNLIHRDISPSNILLSGAGEVKLTDFGIAKASTHRSVFYKVKGKVGYMSPEQARGEAVDARSDLFSLGVVLYEVLVGERLFVGDLMSSASQIYAQPIQAPSQKRREIPADLDAVILKALSLDPGGRFQSAEEFQEALTRVATRHRLMVGASEMAGHLKQVAGEDAATWLKLELFGPERGEPTQAHGTAVLSSVADDDDEQRAQFDLSDEPDDDDDSDVDDILRARNRPPSLPTGELTSVIAVRRGGGDGQRLTKVRGDDLSLPPQPLQPLRRSEPHAAPGSSSAPRRDPAAPIAEFGHDESRAQTVVRDGSPRNLLPGPPPPRSVPAPGEQTVVHPPSQAAFARSQLGAPHGSGPRPDPLGPAPAQPMSPLAGRRLPASGIRPKPQGAAFDGTAYVRRRPRRLIGIMIVLLLIGIGVALGVAFSGPELDVVDPTMPVTVPQAAPAAVRQPPPPAELPGPPPAPTTGP